MPQQRSAPPTLTPEQEYERIKHRIPKFNGIRPAAGDKWEAFTRRGDGCGPWTSLGVFDSISEAWNAYRNAHVPRKHEAEESDGKVETLLALASYPVKFEIEASLHGSSLDLRAEG
jgi:hypothetical protein